MNEAAMSQITIELIKGGFTLAAVALGSGIGFLFYFRQKEYELTKQRYLEQGIDLVAGGLESAMGVISHNYARSLQLCRQYRDFDSNFQAKELEAGFLELNSSNFYQTAQYRVGSLLQDQIVWEVFQSALAYAASANAFISQEIPDSIRILSNIPSGNRDKAKDVERMMEQLCTKHDESFKYAFIGRELHALTLLLEDTRLSRMAIAKFHERKDVVALVNRLRHEFKYPNELAE